MLLIAFVWFFANGLFYPLYSLFAEGIGGDLFQIGGAYSVYLITEGIFTIAFGRIPIQKQRFNAMLLIAGYMLYAIILYFYIFITEPISLFIVEFITGIASALATPSWDALYTWNMKKRESNNSWGIYEGGASIVRGIALLVGVLILSFFNFQALFLTMAIIVTISTVYLLILNAKTDFNVKEMK